MSPVRASSASTLFCGVVMNIAPSLTIGGDSWPSVRPVANAQAGCRSETLPVVTWSSGLNPQPL